MMKLPALSLRTRIQLWHGLMLACILAALGVAAWRLRWAEMLRNLDRDLSVPLSSVHEALHGSGLGRQRLARGLPEDFQLAPQAAEAVKGRGCYFVIWRADGVVAAKSPDAPAESLRPAETGHDLFATRWRSSGVFREAYRFTPPGECLLVGTTTTPALAELGRFGAWLLMLGAGVLVAGLLVDGWILRRAILPVERIISAAEHISRGNLGTRIETTADSAELARLTRVLNTTFASLDRAFTQQARFSADVAHELRTPVSVLIAEAQGALERERAGGEYRETIATTLRSARRMSGLIEPLLDLAQIESGTDPVRSACDLAVLSAEGAENHRGMAQAQGVVLEQRLKKAPCQANEALITQVITNLLVNAIQHNERGGRVRIETGIVDGTSFVRVENTGPGIPPSDLPHVFDRFYRADTSRSRRTGGVGLGLAICKAIAEAHDAELTVESEPGNTRFVLRLPHGLDETTTSA